MVYLCLYFFFNRFGFLDRNKLIIKFIETRIKSITSNFHFICNSLQDNIYYTKKTSNSTKYGHINFHRDNVFQTKNINNSMVGSLKLSGNSNYFFYPKYKQIFIPHNFGELIILKEIAFNYNLHAVYTNRETMQNNNNNTNISMNCIADYHQSLMLRPYDPTNVVKNPPSEFLKLLLSKFKLMKPYHNEMLKQMKSYHILKQQCNQLKK